ncbi:MAG: response regulator [Longimicrobiales bacterium]|nr:response regulator [Longimicrobiales bacterium]
MARILVVDDDALDRMILDSLVNQAGHEPVFAEDGEEAMALFERQEFDLVVTDLVMPKVNGLRLIRQIMEVAPDTAIIAITGTSPEQLSRAQDYGAVVTLVKPLDPDILFQTIEDVLAEKEPSQT